jgi:prepilin-type N-terminal cleavage/methylation domain-containing protein
MRRTAFTLLELAIVLVLISILAAVALPRFGTSTAYATGRSAAERIAADIAWQRSEAVRRQEELKVRFDVTLNQIDWSRAADVWDPDHPSAKYIVTLDDEVPGVSLVSADFGGRDELAFDQWGTPASGGSVVIAQGDTQWTIVVEPGTGRATISE